MIRAERQIYPADEYSPLVADRSGLIRTIAGAQILASKLYVWCEEKPDRDFTNWIYENRGLFHGSDTMISAYLKENVGVSAPDFLLLFLHSLIDFKKELDDRIVVRPDAVDNKLRGNVRLYQLIEKCQVDLDRHYFDIEPEGAHFDFTYSEKVFSTLNALNSLNVIRMYSWGQRKQPSRGKKQDRWREMYVLEVSETHIRETLLRRRGTSILQGDMMRELRELAEDPYYLGVFQKLYGG